MTKRCSRCCRQLTLDHFHRAAKGTHGVAAYCKECQQTRQKEWRAERKNQRILPQSSTKPCSTCGRVLPVTEFYPNVGGPGGLASCCKPCQRKKSKNWRQRNIEHTRRMSAIYEQSYKGRRREIELLKYGLTVSEAQRVVTQKACAICEVVPRNKNLDIDHDHKTEKFRGLLCNSCNRGLGHFKDNPEFLRKAASYLEGFKIVSSCES